MLFYNHYISKIRLLIILCKSYTIVKHKFFSKKLLTLDSIGTTILNNDTRKGEKLCQQNYLKNQY